MLSDQATNWNLSHLPLAVLEDELAAFARALSRRRMACPARAEKEGAVPRNRGGDRNSHDIVGQRGLAQRRKFDQETQKWGGTVSQPKLPERDW